MTVIEANMPRMEVNQMRLSSKSQTTADMAAARRTIIFNRVFFPNTEATAAILHDLMNRLFAMGTDVSVVCATPASASEQSATVGDRVIRLSWPTKHGIGGLAGKALNYLLFTLSSLFFLSRRHQELQLVVFWGDPPFLHLLGGMLCRLRKVPFMIVMQDWYLEGLVQQKILKPTGFLYRLLKRVEVAIFRSSDRTICISEDTAAKLRRLGVSNVSVIENWCPYEPRQDAPDDSSNVFGISPKGQKRCILKYAGNLGFACDLESLESALKILPDPERFVFLFQAVGRRMDYLQKLARKYPNVMIQPWVAPQELAKSMRSCDAHLILTPPGLLGVVYPSKFYTILAHGMPVLASCPFASVLHEQIKTSGAGFSAPAENSHALVAMLENFYDAWSKRPSEIAEMSKNARRFTETKWNGEMAAAAYRDSFFHALPKTHSQDLMRKCISTGLISLLCVNSVSALAQDAKIGESFDLSRRYGISSEFFSEEVQGEILITVELIGAVHKPGIYHVPKHTDLYHLMALAGGPTINAELEKVVLKRTSADKILTQRINMDKILSEPGRAPPPLQASDRIWVPTQIPLFKPDTISALTITASVFSVLVSGILLSNAVKNGNK